MAMADTPGYIRIKEQRHEDTTMQLNYLDAFVQLSLTKRQRKSQPSYIFDKPVHRNDS